MTFSMGSCMVHKDFSSWISPFFPSIYHFNTDMGESLIKLKKSKDYIG